MENNDEIVGIGQHPQDAVLAAITVYNKKYPEHKLSVSFDIIRPPENTNGKYKTKFTIKIIN